MFSDIPGPIRRRMRKLEAREARDARERLDGTRQLARLRQIPPVTGRLLSLVAATAPGGRWIEIGTSGGYSALWLALAARERGARLTTFELLPEKARLARETFAVTGVADARLDSVVVPIGKGVLLARRHA